MIRRPPTSTLFPTRRSSDLRVLLSVRDSGPGINPEALASLFQPFRRARGRPGYCFSGTRSEEHTSELQSLTNLVCRLLLEKKKNNDVIFKKMHLEQHTATYN